MNTQPAQRTLHRIRLSLLAFAAVLVAACGGDESAPAPPPPAVGSATIGAAGGTVNGPDGVQLVIPPDALSGPVSIRIARNAAGTPALPAEAGQAATYEITPHDLAFAFPVQVRLPLAASAGASPVAMAAAPGGAWAMVPATFGNGVATIERATLSYFTAWACSIPAGSTDPYPCVQDSVVVTDMTTTPAGGYEVIPWPGNVVVRAFTAPVTARYRLAFLAPRDCAGGQLRVRRIEIPVGGPAQPAQVELAGQSITLTPSGNTSASTGTFDFVTQVSAAQNGTLTFGFDFTCTRGYQGQQRFATSYDSRLVRIAPPPAAPTITQQPASATVTAGGTVSFTVLASGSATLTFVWERSNDNGATWQPLGAGTTVAGGSSYSLTAALADDRAQFRARVCNVAGAQQTCITSRAALLTVTPAPVAPSITQPPLAQTINAGGGATFVVAASGTPTPTFTWTLNGTPIGSGQFQIGTCIGNATTSNFGAALSLTSVSPQCNGATIAVTASNGVLPSATASTPLTVLSIAPAITQAPLPQTIFVGGGATFTAAASGIPTPTLTWTLNGSPVGGGGFAFGGCIGSATATSGGGTLSLTSVSIGCNGATVAVTASNGVLPNATAGTSLTVTSVPIAPTITAQPTNLFAAEGGGGSFSILVAGTPTPTVQWRIGTTALGTTGSFSDGGCSFTYTTTNGTQLNLSGVTLGCSGRQFSALVSNSAGSVTSNTVTLAVSPAATAPTITQPPVAATTTAGGSASFSVTATGSGTLSYAWTLNGNALPATGGFNIGGCIGNVTGGDSAFVTLDSLTAACNGAAIAVTVSNGTPPDASSTPVALTVLPAASAVGGCFGGASGWCYVQPAPNANRLRALAFTSTGELVVGGDVGTFQRSTDFGSTWTLRWTTNASNERHGWNDLALPTDSRIVAISEGSGINGTQSAPAGIYVSDDGGANWTLAQPESGLTSVAFQDANVGVAVGRFLDRIWRTTDGGSTWTQRAVTLGGIELYRVVHAGGTVFVAVGQNGAIWRSADSGLNWSSVASGVTDALVDLAFNGAGIGLVVRAGQTQLLRSADFGVSWQSVNIPMSASTVGFASATVAAVLGDISGESIRSTDAGLTWSSTSFDLSSGQQNWRMRFASATTGIAVGNYGAVARTVNGGQSWTRIAGGTAFDRVEDLQASPDRSVVLGAMAGEVKRSIDGGRTWSDPASGRRGMNGFSWGSNTRALGFASGLGIYRTDDAGQNWTQVLALPPNTYSRAVAMASPTVALAARNPFGVPVGQGGVLERTTDGGSTWAPVSLPGVSDFWVVAARFASSTLGYVGGTGLWRTTDGGANWTRLTLPAPSSGVEFVSEVHVTPGGVLFVVTGDAVLRSTDQGATFTSVLDNQLVGLIRRIAFVDTNVGLGVGTGGIYRTSDAGLTWTRLDLPLDEFMWSVTWAAADTALVGGEFAALLRNQATGQPAAPPPVLRQSVRSRPTPTAAAASAKRLAPTSHAGAATRGATTRSGTRSAER